MANEWVSFWVFHQIFPKTIFVLTMSLVLRPSLSKLWSSGPIMNVTHGNGTVKGHIFNEVSKTEEEELVNRQ